ncbi:hypothetical protein HDV01_003513 [Terramyces sp. JEL0728]|nr:hypothetical protein HDV01_003513 [Terramyces sp. JEL0728]
MIYTNEIQLVTIHLNIIEYYRLLCAFKQPKTNLLQTWQSYEDSLQYFKKDPSNNLILLHDYCTRSVFYTLVELSHVYQTKHTVKLFDTLTRLQALEINLKIGNYNPEIYQILAADIDLPDTLKKIAFERASHFGCFSILKSLDMCPSTSENILVRSSCKYGYMEMLLHYINHPKVDLQCFNNAPLVSACKSNHIQIVELLLKTIDPSVNNNECIRICAKYGYIDLVKLLLRDPRVVPTDTLWRCCINGHFSTVKYLMDYVEPYESNNLAIRQACINGNVDIIKLLLDDSRVDPSDHDNEAIKYASYFGHLKVVEMLLSDPRVDCNADKGMSLFYAIQNGHSGVVELLAGKILPRLRHWRLARKGDKKIFDILKQKYFRWFKSLFTK